LGKHGSAASHAEYARLVAEWQEGGYRLPAPKAAARGTDAPADLTVNELLLAFLRHSERYYRAPHGRPTPELKNFKQALRPVKQHYGQTPARDFGPLALKAVRTAMVNAGLARTTVNARIEHVRRVFRWAAAEELLPVEVHQALATVPGLQRGRS